MSILHGSTRSPAVPQDPEPSDVVTAADDLLCAARRLNSAATRSAEPAAEVRHAIAVIAQALGELSAVASTVRRQFAGGTPSTMLDLRTHGLISALSAARRDAELVCRHLPSSPLTGHPGAAR